MKRSHEQDDSEDETTSSKAKLQEGERDILHDLQSNLRGDELNQDIEKRLFETQKKYYTVYLEKLIKQIPIGRDLINIISDKDGIDQFEYMFTAAKSMVQSEMHVKQTRAFHAVFDMISGLVCRYVHEKVVTPTLSHVMSSNQLRMAYNCYQSCAKTEEDSSSLELESLLYTIQETLKRQETLKIPNPFYSRATRQMKAMSDYIIALLVAMAKPELENVDPQETIAEE